MKVKVVMNVGVWGEVRKKLNTIQLVLFDDIAFRIKNNLATPTANGSIDLYMNGSLVKSLPFTPDNITDEELANGRSVKVTVQDLTTETYEFNEMRLHSAVSGYDGSGSGVDYAIITYTETQTKPSDQALIIEWTLNFVRV